MWWPTLVYYRGSSPETEVAYIGKEQYTPTLCCVGPGFCTRPAHFAFSCDFCWKLQSRDFAACNAEHLSLHQQCSHGDGLAPKPSAQNATIDGSSRNHRNCQVCQVIVATEVWTCSRSACKGIGFCSKDHLMIHLRNHELQCCVLTCGNGLNEFKCEICTAQACDQEHLNEHVASIHSPSLARQTNQSIPKHPSTSELASAPQPQLKNGFKDPTSNTAVTRHVAATSSSEDVHCVPFLDRSCELLSSHIDFSRMLSKKLAAHLDYLPKEARVLLSTLTTCLERLVMHELTKRLFCGIYVLEGDHVLGLYCASLGAESFASAGQVWRDADRQRVILRTLFRTARAVHLIPLLSRADLYAQTTWRREQALRSAGPPSSADIQEANIRQLLKEIRGHLQGKGLLFATVYFARRVTPRSHSTPFFCETNSTTTSKENCERLWHGFCWDGGDVSTASHTTPADGADDHNDDGAEVEPEVISATHGGEHVSKRLKMPVDRPKASDSGAKQSRNLKHCTACGEPGHNRSTCRRREKRPHLPTATQSKSQRADEPSVPAMPSLENALHGRASGWHRSVSESENHRSHSPVAVLPPGSTSGRRPTPRSDGCETPRPAPRQDSTRSQCLEPQRESPRPAPVPAIHKPSVYLKDTSPITATLSLEPDDPAGYTRKRRFIVTQLLAEEDEAAPGCPLGKFLGYEVDRPLIDVSESRVWPTFRKKI